MEPGVKPPDKEIKSISVLKGHFDFNPRHIVHPIPHYIGAAIHDTRPEMIASHGGLPGYLCNAARHQNSTD